MSSFSLDRLNFLPETGKIGYTYLQKKHTAEMTLKVDQGHWWWRN